MIHCTELINYVSTKTHKTINSTSLMDNITLMITISIYQLAIYLSTEIINLIFNQNLKCVAISINFFILTIYHSFCFYNNLWQKVNIQLQNRINIFETKWPYYIGYGTTSTLLYISSYNKFVFMLYKVNTIFVLILPFVISSKKVRGSETKIENKYPKINLSIFSYQIRLFFSLINYLFG